MVDTKSMLIMCDDYEMYDQLSDEDAGKVFKALMHKYGAGEEPEEGAMSAFVILCENFTKFASHPLLVGIKHFLNFFIFHLTLSFPLCIDRILLRPSAAQPPSYVR